MTSYLLLQLRSGIAICQAMTVSGCIYFVVFPTSSHWNVRFQVAKEAAEKGLHLLYDAQNGHANREDSKGARERKNKTDRRKSIRSSRALSPRLHNLHSAEARIHHAR